MNITTTSIVAAEHAAERPMSTSPVTDTAQMVLAGAAVATPPPWLHDDEAFLDILDKIMQAADDTSSWPDGKWGNTGRSVTKLFGKHVKKIDWQNNRGILGVPYPKDHFLQHLLSEHPERSWNHYASNIQRDLLHAFPSGTLTQHLQIPHFFMSRHRLDIRTPSPDTVRFLILTMAMVAVQNEILRRNDLIESPAGYMTWTAERHAAECARIQQTYQLIKAGTQASFPTLKSLCLAQARRRQATIVLKDLPDDLADSLGLIPYNHLYEPFVKDPIFVQEETAALDQLGPTARAEYQQQRQRDEEEENTLSQQLSPTTRAELRRMREQVLSRLHKQRPQTHELEFFPGQSPAAKIDMLQNYILHSRLPRRPYPLENLLQTEVERTKAQVYAAEEIEIWHDIDILQQNVTQLTSDINRLQQSSSPLNLLPSVATEQELLFSLTLQRTDCQKEIQSLEEALPTRRRRLTVLHNELYIPHSLLWYLQVERKYWLKWLSHVLQEEKIKRTFKRLSTAAFSGLPEQATVFQRLFRSDWQHDDQLTAVLLRHILMLPQRPQAWICSHNNTQLLTYTTHLATTYGVPFPVFQDTQSGTKAYARHIFRTYLKSRNLLSTDEYPHFLHDAALILPYNVQRRILAVFLATCAADNALKLPSMQDTCLDLLLRLNLSTLTLATPQTSTPDPRVLGAELLRPLPTAMQQRLLYMRRQVLTAILQQSDYRRFVQWQTLNEQAPRNMRTLNSLEKGFHKQQGLVRRALTSTQGALPDLPESTNLLTLQQTLQSKKHERPEEVLEESQALAKHVRILTEEVAQWSQTQPTFRRRTTRTRVKTLANHCEQLSQVATAAHALVLEQHTLGNWGAFHEHAAQRLEHLCERLMTERAEDLLEDPELASFALLLKQENAQWLACLQTLQEQFA